jgi:hypothetical protein
VNLSIWWIQCDFYKESDPIVLSFLIQYFFVFMICGGPEKMPILHLCMKHWKPMSCRWYIIGHRSVLPHPPPATDGQIASRVSLLFCTFVGFQKIILSSLLEFHYSFFTFVSFQKIMVCSTNFQHFLKIANLSDFISQKKKFLLLSIFFE